MSDRHRVSLILQSEAYRKELERTIEEQLQQNNAPASLLALQQISDLLMPNHKLSQGAFGAGSKQKPGMHYYYKNKKDKKLL